VTDAGHLGGRQIVPDDDVAGGQRRHQTALDLAAEDRAVHRLVDDKGCGDRIDPQAGNKGGCFPVPVRHPTDQPGAAPAPAALARQIGGGAGRVDKHQLFWVKLRLQSVFPILPRRRHVRALRLGGRHGFF
jgi:hypothetical protein